MMMNMDDNAFFSAFYYQRHQESTMVVCERKGCAILVFHLRASFDRAADRRLASFIHSSSGLDCNDST